MVMNRGEIWWADLRPPIASEPGYKRPVLIIQSNHFNQSRIETVIAATLTSNIKLAQAPGNVLLPKKITNLSKDSVVNISQLITLDKSFLAEYVTSLPINYLKRVENGIRLILEL